LQEITGAPLNKIMQLECYTWSLEICHLNSCTTLSACRIATVLKQDPYKHVCLSLISWQCCFSSALCTVIKLRLSRNCNLWLRQPLISNGFPKQKVSLSNRNIVMYFEPIVSDHVSQVTTTIFRGHDFVIVWNLVFLTSCKQTLDRKEREKMGEKKKWNYLLLTYPYLPTEGIFSNTSPLLWKFQLSFIHFFKFIGLPDPPPP